MELNDDEFEVLISQHTNLSKIGSPSCRLYHHCRAEELRQNRAARRKESQEAQKRAA